MNRKIKKTAVLGSGIMGSRIACHFANIGVEVLLLDIPPRELNAKEQAKGLSLDHPAVRNRLVNEYLQGAIKGRPAALFVKDSAKLISTGNLSKSVMYYPPLCNLIHGPLSTNSFSIDKFYSLLFLVMIYDVTIKKLPLVGC